MPNFSIISYGVSGTQKSTLALLLLSHFGEFDSVHCLSNFNDTSNALTERAFKIKDALMVIDDFHPEASKKTSEDNERILQRLIREFSNRTGRGRLNADSTEKERHEPRAFLLVTAEELPRIQSTVARTLVLEFKKNDVDLSKLTRLQDKAHLLPYAMTSWLRWISEHVDEIRQTSYQQHKEFRDKASQIENIHNKLPEQVAYLQYAAKLIGQWWKEIGFMSEEQIQRFLNMTWDTLTQNIKEQAILLKEEDPVNIFLATLETLITQGKVRIEDRMDNTRIYVGDKDKDLVGYVDTSLEYLYLIGGGVWNAVKKYLSSEGTHFPVSKNTLFKMLKNRGIVFSTNEKSVHTVKVKDDGESAKCQKVLQLRLWESIRNAILNQDLILKGEYWFKEKVLKEEVIKDVAV